MGNDSEVNSTDLSALVGHLFRAMEQDKEKMARDLHNDLGGLLTAARMDVAWLQSMISGQSPEVTRRLAELNATLQEAMNVKRQVVDALHPALLTHFGLGVAMQTYYEDTCTKAGIECITEIVDGDQWPPLSADVAIALFRAGQELLSTLVQGKYSDRVQLRLALKDHHVEMTLRDAGRASSTPSPWRSDARDISAVKQRIASLHGNFAVETAADETVIRISVPNAVVSDGEAGGGRPKSRL